MNNCLETWFAGGKDGGEKKGKLGNPPRGRSLPSAYSAAKRIIVIVGNYPLKAINQEPTLKYSLLESNLSIGKLTARMWTLKNPIEEGGVLKQCRNHSFLLLFQARIELRKLIIL